jgi:transposase-like protein/AraC-like DNA-binding protein
VTIPLLAFISKRVPGSQLQAAAEKTLAYIREHYEVCDPDTWIMINADFLTPLPRPGVNLWQARKLKNSLDKAIFIESGTDIKAENKSAPSVFKKCDEQATENIVSTAGKRKNSPDEEKVMERVMLGWRVKDICEEQHCSEAYVYKLIKKLKGKSAMDYRWKQWELIAAMYHAEPKMTIDQIEKACGVSRAVIYHAVRKIAERDGKELTPRERERKLSTEDVELIKQKLADGVLRKDICIDYCITLDTLIKYIGIREDHKVISDELKDYAVRLRVQGKTLQQTADIIGVTVGTVKKAWSKVKNSPQIKENRVKYDNRNVLSKRDRDQAVNAVLRDGHTRKQIYTQYGINAITLRRYIRDALKKETQLLRTTKADTDKDDDN